LSYGVGPLPTKSYGGDYDHPVVSSSSKAYGGGYGNGEHSGRPTATKTSTSKFAHRSNNTHETDLILATYVDVCETGLTTATATYTRTCYDGEDDSDWTHTGVPDGWIVTVTEYVPYNGAKPTTITVTRPHTVTIPKDTPAKPTDAPYVKPGYNGGDAKPVSTLVVVVTPVPVAEYSAYIASKPSAPVDGSYVKPAYDSGSKAQSSAIAKPVTGYSPSKAADSWPLGAQPTASGTKAGSYAPQFTGAASRAQVGLSLFAGVAVAALAAF
jgi:chitinase